MFFLNLSRKLNLNVDKIVLNRKHAFSYNIAQANNSFRTSEQSPNNHTHQHAGLYYTIPVNVKKQIFAYGGFPKKFEKQVKTFAESSIMIRNPALEVINLIKQSDMSKPVNRFILYGKDGVGKSLSLAHILHYGFESEYILVHIPWVSLWFKQPKETGPSNTKEGFIDLPLDAAAWLIHFKNSNQNLLQKVQLTTSQDYVWSKREITSAGSPLSELIEHGITRVKFACDTVNAVLQELKLHSTAGRCKTMVAIDGVNSFFFHKTKISAENKVKVTPDKVTLTEAFLNITKSDWSNGVVIATVDKIAMTEGFMDSEFPIYLLGKEGFEHFDPFVPIHVDNFNDKEFERCIEYYVDRKWIQNCKTGFSHELKFLSGKNPYKLMQMCASL